MRRWADLAAPDDPGVWYDVNGVYPTTRGTYRTAHFVTSNSIAAAGAGTVGYAWCANTLSSRVEYVVDATHIWQYAAGAYTDRTGGVTVGTKPMMAQYGDVTIGVMQVGNATVKATGGNFSALAGAPQGEIVLTVSNAVLVLNTNTSVDGWAASDVGDYTNWSTGEAASGRLIQTPGPITAGVSFGDYAIVFKGDAIYRGRYVGGAVKWAWEVLYRGIGCQSVTLGLEAKYMACAGNGGTLFFGFYDQATINFTSYAYYFDGASAPVRVNPDTAIFEGRICYNPQDDVFAVSDSLFNGGRMYFYCPKSGAWGKNTNTTVIGANVAAKALLGDFSARLESASQPTMYVLPSAGSNLITRFAAGVDPGSSATCYVQSSKMGSVEGQTTFSRVIPLLRRRIDLGTDSASLSFDLFAELHDTTATTTTTVAESTLRKCFDVLGGPSSARFGRFKVTFAALDVEIDDLRIKSKFVPDGN